MSIQPLGFLRVLVEHERYHHLLRCRASEIIHQLLTSKLRRLHMKLHFPAFRLDQKLIPQKLDLLLHLRFGHLLHCFISVDVNKDQQGITGSKRQLISAKCLERHAEAMVCRSEIHLLLIRPLRIRIRTGQLQQTAETSLLRKPDIVNLRQLVKIHEFIIDFHLQVIRFPRNLSCYLCRNRDRIKIFHHGYTLISLYNIEFIHIFVNLDWITNSLFDLTVTQCRPFGTKFCLIIKQWHEVVRKCVCSSDIARSNDTIQRNLYDAKRHLTHDIHAL